MSRHIGVTLSAGLRGSSKRSFASLVYPISKCQRRPYRVKGTYCITEQNLFNVGEHPFKLLVAQHFQKRCIECLWGGGGGSDKKLVVFLEMTHLDNQLQVTDVRAFCCYQFKHSLEWS